MRRLVTSPQVAAFTADVLQAQPVEPAEYVMPASARQVGDVLEVTGVNSDGERVVVKRIPIGKTIGNRDARRAETSRLKRQLRKGR